MTSDSFADSFADFVTARSPRLLRTAYLLTRDWAAAEDLLQTALVRAWGAWKRLDSDPEPYVRRILVNTYSSWWQRRWRGEQATGEVPVSALDDPHAAVDERDRVWRALDRLPRRQRAVLVLRYFEDLPEVEIADVLGISPGTVKSQAAKALAKLRLDESLQPEGAPLTTPAQRLAQVEKKITQRRRRRIAVGAAGAVVLLLLFFAGYRIIAAHRPPQTPITPPTPSLFSGFREYDKGYRMVATATLPRGHTSMDLTFTPTSTTIGIFMRCVAPKGYQIQAKVVFPNGSRQEGPCPDGIPAWSDPQLPLGVPLTAHITVTIIPRPERPFVDDMTSPMPLPDGAEYAIAVAEPVEFADFPLPSRPAQLEPIAIEPRCWHLRGDPADPLKPKSISGSWRGSLIGEAVMQTPGILHITVNGVERPSLISWDYGAEHFLNYWDTGIPAEERTRAMTITVTPERVTGDWAVEITQERPDGRSEDCVT